MYKDFYISKLPPTDQAWIRSIIPLAFNRYSLYRSTDIAIGSNKDEAQYNQYYFVLMLIYRK